MDKNVHVQEAKDPFEESRYILDEIRETVKEDVSFTDIAVLYRTVSDGRILAETLMEYQIPFQMKEHLNDIYDHFIGQDLYSYLALSQGKQERAHYLRVVNRPNRYIGRDSMSEGRVSFESLRNFYCDKKWMQDRIDQFEWDMKMLRDKAPYL